MLTAGIDSSPSLSTGRGAFVPPPFAALPPLDPHKPFFPTISASSTGSSPDTPAALSSAAASASAAASGLAGMFLPSPAIQALVYSRAAAATFARALLRDARADARAARAASAAREAAQATGSAGGDTVETAAAAAAKAEAEAEAEAEAAAEAEADAETEALGLSPLAPLVLLCERFAAETVHSQLAAAGVAPDISADSSSDNNSVAGILSSSVLFPPRHANRPRSDLKQTAVRNDNDSGFVRRGTLTLFTTASPAPPHPLASAPRALSEPEGAVAAYLVHGRLADATAAFCAYPDAVTDAGVTEALLAALAGGRRWAALGRVLRVALTASAVAVPPAAAVVAREPVVPSLQCLLSLLVALARNTAAPTPSLLATAQLLYTALDATLEGYERAEDRHLEPAAAAAAAAVKVEASQSNKRARSSNDGSRGETLDSSDFSAKWIDDSIFAVPFSPLSLTEIGVLRMEAATFYAQACLRLADALSSPATAGLGPVSAPPRPPQHGAQPRTGGSQSPPQAQAQQSQAEFAAGAPGTPAFVADGHTAPTEAKARLTTARYVAGAGAGVASGASPAKDALTQGQFLSSDHLLPSDTFPQTDNSGDSSSNARTSSVWQSSYATSPAAPVSVLPPPSLPYSAAALPVPASALVALARTPAAEAIARHALAVLRRVTDMAVARGASPADPFDCDWTVGLGRGDDDYPYLEKSSRRDTSQTGGPGLRSESAEAPHMTDALPAAALMHGFVADYPLVAAVPRTGNAANTQSQPQPQAQWPLRGHLPATGPDTMYGSRYLAWAHARGLTLGLDGIADREAAVPLLSDTHCAHGTRSRSEPDGQSSPQLGVEGTTVSGGGLALLRLRGGQMGDLTDPAFCEQGPFANALRRVGDTASGRLMPLQPWASGDAAASTASTGSCSMPVPTPVSDSLYDAPSTASNHTNSVSINSSKAGSSIDASNSGINAHSEGCDSTAANNGRASLSRLHPVRPWALHATLPPALLSCRLALHIRLGDHDKVEQFARNTELALRLPPPYTAPPVTQAVAELLFAHAVLTAAEGATTVGRPADPSALQQQHQANNNTRSAGPVRSPNHNVNNCVESLIAHSNPCNDDVDATDTGSRPVPLVPAVGADVTVWELMLSRSRRLNLARERTDMRRRAFEQNILPTRASGSVAEGEWLRRLSHSSLRCSHLGSAALASNNASDDVAQSGYEYAVGAALPTALALLHSTGLQLSHTNLVKTVGFKATRLGKSSFSGTDNDGAPAHSVTESTVNNKSNNKSSTGANASSTSSFNNNKNEHQKPQQNKSSQNYNSATTSPDSARVSGSKQRQQHIQQQSRPAFPGPGSAPVRRLSTETKRPGSATKGDKPATKGGSRPPISDDVVPLAPLVPLGALVPTPPLGSRALPHSPHLLTAPALALAPAPTVCTQPPYPGLSVSSLGSGGGDPSVAALASAAAAQPPVATTVYGATARAPVQLAAAMAAAHGSTAAAAAAVPWWAHAKPGPGATMGEALLAEPHWSTVQPTPMHNASNNSGGSSNHMASQLLLSSHLLAPSPLVEPLSPQGAAAALLYDGYRPDGSAGVAGCSDGAASRHLDSDMVRGTLYDAATAAIRSADEDNNVTFRSNASASAPATVASAEQLFSSLGDYALSSQSPLPLSLFAGALYAHDPRPVSPFSFPPPSALLVPAVPAAAVAEAEAERRTLGRILSSFENVTASSSNSDKTTDSNNENGDFLADAGSGGLFTLSAPPAPWHNHIARVSRLFASVSIALSPAMLHLLRRLCAREGYLEGELRATQLLRLLEHAASKGARRRAEVTSTWASVTGFTEAAAWEAANAEVAANLARNDKASAGNDDSNSSATPVTSAGGSAGESKQGTAPQLPAAALTRGAGAAAAADSEFHCPRALLGWGPLATAPPLPIGVLLAEAYATEAARAEARGGLQQRTTAGIVTASTHVNNGDAELDDAEEEDHEGFEQFFSQMTNYSPQSRWDPYLPVHSHDCAHRGPALSGRLLARLLSRKPPGSASSLTDSQSEFQQPVMRGGGVYRYARGTMTPAKAVTSHTSSAQSPAGAATAVPSRYKYRPFHHAALGPVPSPRSPMLGLVPPAAAVAASAVTAPLALAAQFPAALPVTPLSRVGRRGRGPACGDDEQRAVAESEAVAAGLAAATWAAHGAAAAETATRDAPLLGADRPFAASSNALSGNSGNDFDADIDITSDDSEWREWYHPLAVTQHTAIASALKVATFRARVRKTSAQSKDADTKGELSVGSVAALATSLVETYANGAHSKSKYTTSTTAEGAVLPGQGAFVNATSTVAQSDSARDSSSESVTVTVRTQLHLSSPLARLPPAAQVSRLQRLLDDDEVAAAAAFVKELLMATATVSAVVCASVQPNIAPSSQLSAAAARARGTATALCAVPVPRAVRDVLVHAFAARPLLSRLLAPVVANAGAFAAASAVGAVPALALPPPSPPPGGSHNHGVVLAVTAETGFKALNATLQGSLPPVIAVPAVAAAAAAGKAARATITERTDAADTADTTNDGEHDQKQQQKLLPLRQRIGRGGATAAARAALVAAAAASDGVSRIVPFGAALSHSQSLAAERVAALAASEFPLATVYAGTASHRTGGAGEPGTATVAVASAGGGNNAGNGITLSSSSVTLGSPMLPVGGAGGIVTLPKRARTGPALGSLQWLSPADVCADIRSAHSAMLSSSLRRSRIEVVRDNAAAHSDCSVTLGTASKSSSQLPHSGSALPLATRALMPYLSDPQPALHPLSERERLDLLSIIEDAVLPLLAVRKNTTIASEGESIANFVTLTPPMSWASFPPKRANKNAPGQAESSTASETQSMSSAPVALALSAVPATPTTMSKALARARARPGSIHSDVAGLTKPSVASAATTTTSDHANSSTAVADRTRTDAADVITDNFEDEQVQDQEEGFDHDDPELVADALAQNNSTLPDAKLREHCENRPNIFTRSLLRASGMSAAASRADAAAARCPLPPPGVSVGSASVYSPYITLASEEIAGSGGEAAARAGVQAPSVSVGSNSALHAALLPATAWTPRTQTQRYSALHATTAPPPLQRTNIGGDYDDDHAADVTELLSRLPASAAAHAAALKLQHTTDSSEDANPIRSQRVSNAARLGKEAPVLLFRRRGRPRQRAGAVLAADLALGNIGRGGLAATAASLALWPSSQLPQPRRSDVDTGAAHTSNTRPHAGVTAVVDANCDAALLEPYAAKLRQGPSKGVLTSFSSPATATLALALSQTLQAIEDNITDKASLYNYDFSDNYAGDTNMARAELFSSASRPITSPLPLSRRTFAAAWAAASALQTAPAATLPTEPRAALELARSILTSASVRNSDDHELYWLLCAASAAHETQSSTPSQSPSLCQSQSHALPLLPRARVLSLTDFGDAYSWDLRAPPVGSRFRRALAALGRIHSEMTYSNSNNNHAVSNAADKSDSGAWTRLQLQQVALCAPPPTPHRGPPSAQQLSISVSDAWFAARVAPAQVPWRTTTTALPQPLSTQVSPGSNSHFSDNYDVTNAIDSGAVDEAALLPAQHQVFMPLPLWRRRTVLAVAASSENPRALSPLPPRVRAFAALAVSASTSAQSAASAFPLWDSLTTPFVPPPQHSSQSHHGQQLQIQYHYMMQQQQQQQLQKMQGQGAVAAAAAANATMYASMNAYREDKQQHKQHQKQQHQQFMKQQQPQQEQRDDTSKASDVVTSDAALPPLIAALAPPVLISPPSITATTTALLTATDAAVIFEPAATTTHTQQSGVIASAGDACVRAGHGVMSESKLPHVAASVRSSAVSVSPSVYAAFGSVFAALLGVAPVVPRGLLSPVPPAVTLTKTNNDVISRATPHAKSTSFATHALALIPSTTAPSAIVFAGSGALLTAVESYRAQIKDVARRSRAATSAVAAIAAVVSTNSVDFCSSSPQENTSSRFLRSIRFDAPSVSAQPFQPGPNGGGGGTNASQSRSRARSRLAVGPAVYAATVHSAVRAAAAAEIAYARSTLPRGVPAAVSSALLPQRKAIFSAQALDGLWSTLRLPLLAHPSMRTLVHPQVLAGEGWPSAARPALNNGGASTQGATGADMSTNAARVSAREVEVAVARLALRVYANVLESGGQYLSYPLPADHRNNDRVEDTQPHTQELEHSHTSACLHGGVPLRMAAINLTEPLPAPASQHMTTSNTGDDSREKSGTVIGFAAAPTAFSLVPSLNALSVSSKDLSAAKLRARAIERDTSSSGTSPVSSAENATMMYKAGVAEMTAFTPALSQSDATSSENYMHQNSSLLQSLSLSERTPLWLLDCALSDVAPGLLAHTHPLLLTVHNPIPGDNTDAENLRVSVDSDSLWSRALTLAALHTPDTNMAHSAMNRAVTHDTFFEQQSQTQTSLNSVTLPSAPLTPRLRLATHSRGEDDGISHADVQGYESARVIVRRHIAAANRPWRHSKMFDSAWFA